LAALFKAKGRKILLYFFYIKPVDDYQMGSINTGKILNSQATEFINSGPGLFFILGICTI